MRSIWPKACYRPVSKERDKKNVRQRLCILFPLWLLVCPVLFSFIVETDCRLSCSKNDSISERTEIKSYSVLLHLGTDLRHRFAGRCVLSHGTTSTDLLLSISEQHLSNQGLFHTANVLVSVAFFSTGLHNPGFGSPNSKGTNSKQNVNARLYLRHSFVPTLRICQRRQ
jgi:hypothetical protein